MKEIGAVRFFALLVMLLLQEVAPPLSYSATQCDPWVAKMVSVQGTVEVRRAGQTQWIPARLNDLYCGSDQVQVGERSRADIALINQPVVRLDQNTTITFGGVKENRTHETNLCHLVLIYWNKASRTHRLRDHILTASCRLTERRACRIPNSLRDAKEPRISLSKCPVFAKNLA
jgi:hypothetical protein